MKARFTLAPCIIAIACLVPVARAAKVEELPRIQALASVLYSFDDNVFGLTKPDIDTLNSIGTGNALDTAANRAKYNGMRSPYDQIAHYRAALSGRLSLLGPGFDTQLTGEAGYYMYKNNPIKDYPTFRGALRQFLTRLHLIEASFTQDTDRFAQNLLGKDLTAMRFPGFYTSRELSFIWRGKFAALRRFEFGTRTAYIWSRYRETQLSYRDFVVRKYEGQLGYQWARALKTTVRYEYASSDAVSLPGSDSDFREHGVGIRGEIKPTRRAGIDLNYSAHFRRYISQLGSTVDPSYSGRKDFRHQAGARVSYEFIKGWRAWSSVDHVSGSSNLNSELATQLPDDAFEFRKNVFSTGIEARFP